MQGGFRHYMTFERNIPKWKENVKDLPKVSVLIPAHNEEVVIRQTLKAMVNLYYPKDRLEIIVVNDNSSDRTGDIVDEFPRNTALLNGRDQTAACRKGKSSALNCGLPSQTGTSFVYMTPTTRRKNGCLLPCPRAHE
ncbi:glycosyltransferase [Bacillus licheniformis]|nr:glycosyltransferase [Bacillus licheniformis]